MPPTVILQCDGCNAVRMGKRDGSLDELREQLATVGWRSDKANDVDACPTCLASGRIV